MVGDRCVLVTPRSLQPAEAGGGHHPALLPLVEAGCRILYPPGRGPFGAETMARMLQEADGAIVGLDVIDGAAIRAAPRLRVIARFGVGIDRLDVEAATAAGVVVTHTPQANSVAVAEYTVALMLAALRHLVDHHAGVVEGRWDPRQGEELAGRRLGLVGLGRVGAEVARRCRAFRMRIGYYDIARRPPSVERRLGVEYMPLGRLLGWCDVLSLHAPHVPGAPPLVDAAALARMRPGSVLVNTARGGLVDEQALSDALRRGQLAAAALDVFQEEPLPAGHPLRASPRVILSPHAASHTRQSARRMARQAVRSVLDVLQGRRPRHVVNPEVLGRLAARDGAGEGGGSGGAAAGAPSPAGWAAEGKAGRAPERDEAGEGRKER